ncbi:MAG: fibronectin type III domain-containing protein, partial [Clostridia bacterium]|nr:fibronectin type III domain-containing protein [Clostridia bacterium]
MKKTRKLLTLLLALTAVVLMMSAMSLSSSAAEVEKVEVESWSQLRDALMAHNDYNPVEIKLTRDISREFDDYEDFDYGLFAVAGDKTLDLNGRTITAEVTIGEENAQYMGGNHFPYLFSFYYVNSSLTIKDTSAAGTGKVHYDASLVKAKNYITSPICDIFGVSYGNLTIDGGTYEVGHVRTDWTTAVYINGKLFTGNLRTQVYGTVFTVGSNANVTINGGKFIARGGQLIVDKTKDSSYVANVFKKTSTTNSYVTINGGTFYGEGGCDIFDDGSMFPGIKINNGLFLTKGIDNVLFRYGGYDGGSLKKGDMHIMPEMLKPGIENKVIVNGGKNYMYASTASPQVFYNNREDTAVFTYYGFIRQTPEIPTDRVTSIIDSVPLGTSRVIAYEEKPLDLYYEVLGFDTMCSFVVRDSSNNIIATRGGTGLKQYNLASITAPGDYTITVTLDLIYDGSVIQKREHTFVVNIYKACTHTYTTISNTATCEKAGVKTERCTLCGDEKITDVAALDHLSLASDWTYNSTHHWYYCRRCYTPLTIQAHSWISSTNRTCSACRYNDNCEWGNAMDTEYDENYHWWPCDTHAPDEPCPNNHQLERELHTILTIENAGSLEHEPQIEYSCQNGYVCDGCGEYFGETGEHRWVLDGRGALRKPTCTTDGYIKYKCYYDGKYDCKGNLITCNEKKTITVPKLGHSFDYNNPVSDTATCTEEGEYTFKCTKCSIKITMSSPKKEHSLLWETEIEAGCTTFGLEKALCERSGCDYSEERDIAPLGHSLGIFETVTEVGCTTAGKNIAYCTVDGCDGFSEEIIDPLGHEMVFEAAKKATLNENGNIEHYDCLNCNHKSSDSNGNVAIDNVSIAKIATIKLSSATVTYNGKVRNPSVTVKDAEGNTLVEGTDYDVTVPEGRKNPGIYKYVVTFKGNYEGEKTLKFTINPETVDVATIKATQSTSVIKLTWGAVEGATGYRVYQYSPSKGKFVQIASVKGVTSYRKATNLKAGTEYKF